MISKLSCSALLLAFGLAGCIGEIATPDGDDVHEHGLRHDARATSIAPARTRAAFPIANLGEDPMTPTPDPMTPTPDPMTPTPAPIPGTPTTAGCTAQRLTTNDGNSLRPAVAWNGTELGVAFNDDRASDQLWFLRLSASGAKLGDEIALATMSHDETPSIAWTGSAWAIAYIDVSQVWLANVAADGTPLGSVQLTHGDAASNVRAVWDGGGLGVAYESAGSVYLARFATDGATLAMPALLASSAHEPAIVWDGATYGVAWSDDRHGDSEIYFARVGTSGSIAGNMTRVSTGDNGSRTPALATSGTGFGLAFIDARFDSDGDLFFARLDGNGALLGAETRVTTDEGAAYLPAIAYGGGVYTMAWNDLRAGDDVRFDVRDAASGAAVIADAAFTTGSEATGYEALAFDGVDAVLVYYDGKDGNNELYAGRVSTAGECL